MDTEIHNHDAELIVIYEAVTDPEWSLPKLAEVLPDSGPFYNQFNAATWKAILELQAAGQPIDQMTLTNRLRQSGHIQPNDYWFLPEIAAEWQPYTGTSYARMVKAAEFERRTLASANKMLSLAHTAGTVDEKQDQIASMFENMMRYQVGGAQENTQSQISAYIDHILHIKPGTLNGPEWPWIDVTRLTLGMSPLTIVGARPGMGKSAFIWQAATESALAGKRVFFWTGEMGVNELMNRYTARKCKIDLERVQSGNIDDQQRAQIIQAAAALNDTQLVISTESATVPSLRRRAQRSFAGKKPDIVFVDYLSLLSSDQSHPNDNSRISHIMGQLNRWRMDLDVPVVVGSQLNRNVTRQSDPRPSLADLRDSGSVEQDATQVIFLHRPDYYAPDGMSERPNVCEVIVSKSRNGKTGVADLYWNGNTTSFANLSHEMIQLPSYNGGRG